MKTWWLWWKISGLTGHITGKSGISKGYHILITCDVSRIWPRVYIHCHKVHKWPRGFGKDGPNEARIVCENITPLIVGEEQQPGAKQIFKSNSRFTYDNYFSGNSIINYLGKNGFAAVMTCRRDRLLWNIPPQYFHKLKTDFKQRVKEARLLHPVVAVKETHT